MHLDSVLSKQPREYKDALAKILPLILRKPHSIAQALSVPVILPPQVPTRLASALYEILKKGSALPEPPGVAEDFPRAWLEECERDWGTSTTHQLIHELTQAPEQVMRAVEMHPATPVLSFDVQPTQLSPWGWKSQRHESVFKEKAYLEGQLEIQDEGSQIIAATTIWPNVFASVWINTPAQTASLEWTNETRAHLKSPRESLRVVDACAGAGGKSLAIASYLKGRGRVFAYDPYEKKLAALRKRAQRMGLRNIQTLQVRMGIDHEQLNKFFAQADIVLVDAPCSGWGVLRRSPDIKWRDDPVALKRLPELQNEILDAASLLVKPGGSLFYSLCTFRLSETGAVVSEFTTKHSEFEKMQGGYLGPGVSDGFFLQRWVKTGQK